jgi:hypothetical protein
MKGLIRLYYNPLYMGHVNETRIRIHNLSKVCFFFGLLLVDLYVQCCMCICYIDLPLLEWVEAYWCS